MKADFSRGFNPDRKRGRNYRRVLLQQGRVLLDSDAAALVDASDRLLRQQTQDLGTDAGGRDRGFMITAGRLYATFRDLMRVPVANRSLSIVRIDYNKRFRQRFPALLLEADETTTGSVVIELFSPHDRGGALVLWVRSDRPPATGFLTDLSDNPYTGTPVSSANTQFERIVLSPPSPLGSDSAIKITLAPTQRLWIAMIESDQTAATEPFWIQAGRFHLRGLMVENDEEKAYPSQVVPPPTSPLTLGANDRAIAYIEGWERLVTAHEDPGIRERALSQSLDTSVRTAAIGQVKTFVYTVTPADPLTELTADQIRGAFETPVVPTGELDLTIAPTVATSSPCAVSLEGGFTGRENHLYHFEVHAVTGSDIQIKWSRQAGAELVPVTTWVGTDVEVGPEFGLREGDLVEVLSDVIDLGDEPTAPAAIVGNQFQPPRRLVGQLASLVRVATTLEGLEQFSLRERTAPGTPVSLNATLYPPQPEGRMRLRRWHGLITTTSPSGAIPIESGLELGVSGSFQVGDWWQFEARLGEDPLSGSLDRRRQGPERLFAPIALLAPDSVLRPEVVQWLDAPFVAAAALTADNLPFDNSLAVQLSSEPDPPFAVAPDELNSMQAAFDVLVQELLFRERIIDRRVLTLVPGDNIILGHWQMTVGDGVNSFGDINGAGAIQKAVQVARALAGAGHPWSLRLLVKRGSYELTESTTVSLGAGEALALTGEGLNAANPFTSGAAPLLRCATDPATPCFVLNGPGAKLELANIAALKVAATGLTQPDTRLVLREAGEVHVSGCRLSNLRFEFAGTVSASPPLYAMTVRDSTLELVANSLGTPAAVSLIGVNFPSLGDCSLILFERSVLRTAVDGAMLTVGPAANPVHFAGLTMRDCRVALTGSASPISATSNSGLVFVATGAVDNVLSIGGLVFENCQVDAGSPSVPGVLLHLASGSDPDPDNDDVRVRSIDKVEIRGGRWTVHSDSALNSAIYVGDRLFDPQNYLQRPDINPRIGKLTVENVDMGWSSASATLQYGSTQGAEHAFVWIARKLTVKGLSFFGMVSRPGSGELLACGTERATIDGIQLEGFRSAGVVSTPPKARVSLYVSGSGASASNIGVIGVGNIATVGVIQLSVGGAPPGTSGIVGRRATLTGCRVRQNNGGAAFYKNDELDLELIDCSAHYCQRGALLTQTIADTPTFLSIRGGVFANCTLTGLDITANSNLAAITVDGVTITGNNGIGLRLGTGPLMGDEWIDRGPIVTNNRVFDNSLSAGSRNPQIVLGNPNVDRISGVCVGNYCRGNVEGVLQVLTLNTYLMRGLSVHDEIPWAIRTIATVPPVTANAQLAFNVARWSP